MPLLVDQALDALRAVRLRACIDEDEGADVARRVAEDRERDVSAKRHAAKDCLLDVEAVEQIDDVAGVVVNGRSRRIGGAALTEPAKIDPTGMKPQT